jgi:hypothetical protein
MSRFGALPSPVVAFDEAPLSASAPRMLRTWLLGSWLAAISLLIGCDSETTTVARTQLTIRLYASQDVLDSMATVRVQTLSGAAVVDMHTFNKAELTKWPVDLAIVPAGDNDSSAVVEIVAEALDTGNKPLVQHRARASFVPREQHLLEMFLWRCGARPLGRLCVDDAACRGDACLTCAAGAEGASCVQTPITSGASLPFLSAAGAPVDKAAPWPVVTDAGFDAGSDAAVDAGPDGGRDAGPDSGLDGGVDAGPDAGSDGGADAGDAGPPQWDGGKFWCGDSYFWQPAFASGTVPAGSPVLANPTITPEGDDTNPGVRNQHICRVAQADGSRITGKANSFSTGPNAGKLDYGCYFARFTPETQTWKGEGVDTEGVSFQMFVPPSICQLSWVKASAGQVIPQNALILATDARFQPFYACRFEVTQPQSTGLHIGRVSGNLGDVCRMQFWGNLLSSESYEILVQDFPPATD